MVRVLLLRRRGDHVRPTKEITGSKNKRFLSKGGKPWRNLRDQSSGEEQKLQRL